MNSRLFVLCVLAFAVLMASTVMGEDVIQKDGDHDWTVITDGITLNIEGNSGKLRLRRNDDTGKNHAELSFDRVVEFDTATDSEKESADLGAKAFEWGTPSYEVLNGVNTTRIEFNASVGKGNAVIHVVVNLYSADGSVTWGGESYIVRRDHAKFSVNIRDWPWKASTNGLRVTFELKVNGDSYKPSKIDDKDSQEDDDVVVTDPKGKEKRVKLDQYGIIDFATNAMIDGVVSNITVDSYTHAKKSGVVLTFPHFESTLDYDPTFGMNSAFHMRAFSFAALISVALAIAGIYM